MYSTHNEGKSVISERFIRTLKKKIYKYMTSISKSVYIDKLDDIGKKYTNTYHKTITMRPADVRSSTYIDSSHKINDKDPKFKVGDIVRTSKYKKILAKGYVPDWSEEVFIIENVKNAVLLTYVLVILKAKKLLERFTKKN